MAQEDKHGRSNVRRRGWEPVQLCRGASVCEAGAWGGATTSGGERSIGYICLTGQKFKFFLEKKKSFAERRMDSSISACVLACSSIGCQTTGIYEPHETEAPSIQKRLLGGFGTFGPIPFLCSCTI